MDNQCPYHLKIAFNPEAEVYTCYPCIKDRHSSGDHETITGLRWHEFDIRSWRAISKNTQAVEKET